MELRPARGCRRDGSREGVRKEETSAAAEGSNKEAWAWEVKEVVGAESPESGGGAPEGAAGLRPVMESQIEAIAGGIV